MKPTTPARIDLARLPTPIEFMPELTGHYGGPEIWFKRDDLTGSALGGNKIRKLEFSLAEALRLDADVVITAGAVQSNHCRATALACSRLGLGCHLVLRGEPETPPDGNLLLDHLAGASVSFYPREVYRQRRTEIVAELTEEYARQGQQAYSIPVGASNAIGSWGYIRAWQEIGRQSERLGICFDHVVVAVGSGGTMAGLVAGRALAGCGKTRVWGINVCDTAESFVHDIRDILDEMNGRFHLGLTRRNCPINMIDGYVGEAYAVPYQSELETIRLCGELEGQVLDPVYTGKAFHGLGEEIHAGRFGRKGRILFVHTGGIFGLFPHRAAFGPY